LVSAGSRNQVAAATAPRKRRVLGTGRNSRIFVDEMVEQTKLVARDKRIPHARDVLPGSGSSRFLVRFADEVGFCLVLKELMIFDSVVVSFHGRQSTDSRSLRIRNGKSQQTLNCALSVDHL